MSRRCHGAEKGELQLPHLRAPVRPQTDTEVTEFLRWPTNTHTMHWHAHYGTRGTGHLYQGRFKSLPVEENDHLYAVLRYVERNPVRVNLVDRAEQWRYGSGWRRHQGTATESSVVSDCLRYRTNAPRSSLWLSVLDKLGILIAGR